MSKTKKLQESRKMRTCDLCHDIILVGDMYNRQELFSHDVGYFSVLTCQSCVEDDVEDIVYDWFSAPIDGDDALEWAEAVVDVKSTSTEHREVASRFIERWGGSLVIPNDPSPPPPVFTWDQPV